MWRKKDMECECRFLILFDDNSVVELCSDISKTESNFSLAQAFASQPNMSFSSVWENV